MPSVGRAGGPASESSYSEIHAMLIGSCRTFKGHGSLIHHGPVDGLIDVPVDGLEDGPVDGLVDRPEHGLVVLDLVHCVATDPETVRTDLETARSTGQKMDQKTDWSTDLETDLSKDS